VVQPRDGVASTRAGRVQGPVKNSDTRGRAHGVVLHAGQALMGATARGVMLHASSEQDNAQSGDAQEYVTRLLWGR
jgi:hypothetical protein